VGEVIEVAEKKVISSNATVGLYAFRKAKDYIQAAEQMIQENERANGEFYVCPVYQKLIQQGKRIGIFEIQSTAMHGLGTPGDLEVFIKNHSSPSSSTKPEMSFSAPDLSFKRAFASATRSITPALIGCLSNPSYFSKNPDTNLSRSASEILNSASAACA
jgi:hypothetical protein